jgi:small conductance mechanosensitive channel
MGNAEQIVETVTTLVTQWGLRVVGAIAVLVVGRMVAGWARKAVRKGLQRSKVDDTLVPFISSLVYYLLLVVVGLMVLDRFGVQTASLVAVLGAAGLAVGLALQGTLSNFSAGVMLLIFRPFKVGDYVDVGGTTGSVVEIGIFTTILKSPDNVKIVVPNSQIYAQTIKNFNGFETRRVDMVMGIGYDDDIQLALDTIRRVVTADPRVHGEPEVQIAVSNLGDSSVDIVVRPWCAASDYWGLKFDLTRVLKEELEGAGCSIPYPQRDVHLFQQAASA